MVTSFGFVRLGAAVPRVRVADCAANASGIVAQMRAADAAGVQLVVFPECALTGYSAHDLFHQQTLQDAACAALVRVCRETAKCAIAGVIGLPLAVDGQLFNCAAVIQAGRVLGIVPKSFIPGYKEFYEPRWFAPAARLVSETVAMNGMDVPIGTDLLFQADDMPSFIFGIEICEDLWSPVPPSSTQAVAGATVLVNLSASTELVAKAEYRRSLVLQQAGRCIAAYVFSSAGVGESTTDVVYSGHALVAENGIMLEEGERFGREPSLVVADADIERLVHDRQVSTSFSAAAGQEVIGRRRIPFSARQPKWKRPLRRSVARHPFVPSDAAARDARCKEIFSIQAAALAKRLEHCRIERVVLGVSGGLDSTLALLVCVRAFDGLGVARRGITAVSMPGFGTSDRTHRNAKKLAGVLGVSTKEIDIRAACLQHFKDIGHEPSMHDIVFENAQARERTQILMDLANQLGAIHVGTGDLSELALGWCTYGGDQISMYNVNCGVPKTLVKYLVQWVAETQVSAAARVVLADVLATPISPELLPPDALGRIAQKTEAAIGPYELHDFFLYHMVRSGARPGKILMLARQAFGSAYSAKEVARWLRVFCTRFFASQFKRSCMPDGPKVGTVSLSPRGDWRMPSDAEAALWLDEIAAVSSTKSRRNA